MRKVLFIAACMVSMTGAQKIEVGLDAGYGLGIGADLVGKNIEMNSSYQVTKYEEVYASGGNGLKIGAEAAYFFLDNIGIMVASGYSMLGSYTTENNDPTTADKLTVTTSFVPVNVGLKLRAKIGRFVPYMYLAPGLYYPKKSGTETITGQTDIKWTWEYDRGFGFTAGIGAVYTIAGKIGAKLEITPTYVFANQTKYASEQDGTTHTTVYWNDKEQLPTSGGEPVYKHGQPRDSFSSIAVRAGICYGFSWGTR